LKVQFPDPVQQSSNGLSEEVELARTIIFETTVATIKVLIRAAASLRQPIGTREAMECAQRLFMLPDTGFEWSEDIIKMINVVWNDSGMQETYKKKGVAYTLEDPDTIVYVCENINRILDIKFIPTDVDVEKTRFWTQLQEEYEKNANMNSNENAKYNSEEKKIAKGGIQDTLFKEMKSMVIKAAHSKIPFGSHEALTCARHMLTLQEENIDWNQEIQQLLEVLWSDSGIKTVLKESKLSYFLENFSRLVIVDYIPTDEDVSQLEKKYQDEETKENQTKTNASNTNANNTNTTPNNPQNPNITNNINNGVGRPISNSLSQPKTNDADSIMLIFSIPSIIVTKTLKAILSETAVELVNTIRKKPGVNLDQNASYVCWISKSDQEPILIDNNIAIRNYNLKNNDTIMLLKVGDKPENHNVKSFHTISVNNSKKGGKLKTKDKNFRKSGLKNSNDKVKKNKKKDK